jgi:hypothetical protein
MEYKLPGFKIHQISAHICDKSPFRRRIPASFKSSAVNTGKHYYNKRPAVSQANDCFGRKRNTACFQAVWSVWDYFAGAMICSAWAAASIVSTTGASG